MMETEADLKAWRKRMRAELLLVREALTPEMHRRKSEQVTQKLLHHFSHVAHGTVGFYCPFRGEIDALPFVEFVLSQGGSAALPVVLGKGVPLEFRSWKPGEPMVNGMYDIPYPTVAQRVEPDVLLVALVGFDSMCYRLGYGGGYYDRTLLAAARKPLTIGIGFASGRLDTIHPQAYDMPMDWIVTEDGMMQREA